MQLELDDNQRGAFHYLFGGVVIVGALRVLAWAVELFGPDRTPEGEVLRPFQQGYWGLRDELAVVGTSAGLSERMVLAVVCAVCATVVVAILCALLLRKRPDVGAWVARSVLLATLGWSVFAALLVPVRETRVANGGLVMVQRQALAGAIPLPFTAKYTSYTRHEVAGILVREVAPQQGCDGRVLLELFIQADGQAEPIAVEANICAAERLDRMRNGSEAAALLERELR